MLYYVRLCFVMFSYCVGLCLRYAVTLCYAVLCYVALFGLRYVTLKHVTLLCNYAGIAQSLQLLRSEADD